MNLIIACDHGGLAIKNAVKKFVESRAYAVTDLGTHSADSVDYSDYAIKAAEAIIEKKVDIAILVCTTGIGMSMAANRFSGVRAALCDSIEAAAMTRSHNDSNVLVLSGTSLTEDKALAITQVFLDTAFSKESAMSAASISWNVRNAWSKSPPRLGGS